MEQRSLRSNAQHRIAHVFDVFSRIVSPVSDRVTARLDYLERREGDKKGKEDVRDGRKTMCADAFRS